jgi:hypothetical protein
MDAEPKASVHPSSQGSRLGAGDGLTRLVEAGHDISGACMGALGAAFLRHEALAALRGTLVLQGIKVAPSAATVLRRLGHRAPRPGDAPAPLILHLERVIRIKKGMSQEQMVVPLLRRRVQRAGSRQFFPFGPHRGARRFQGR